MENLKEHLKEISNNIQSLNKALKMLSEVPSKDFTVQKWLQITRIAKQ